MLKYAYIFKVKYTEAVLSNSTQKLLWSEIAKMLITYSLKNKFIVLFIIILGTFVPYSLQCFDAVGWAAGRASGL